MPPSGSTSSVLVEQPLQRRNLKPVSALAVSVSEAPESTVQRVPVQVAVAGMLDACTTPLAGSGKSTLKRWAKPATQLRSLARLSICRLDAALLQAPPPV